MREIARQVSRLHPVLSSAGILRELEDESIEILRETAATFRNPVPLYSIGKDSMEKKKREGYF